MKKDYLTEEEMREESEKRKKEFYKIQGEKNEYLGEYKERVIAALTKEQIIEDDVYPEILQYMRDNKAYVLKMARDVSIKKLKPYIQEAEKIGLKYQLVDALTYRGNIGLVLASKEALEETDLNEELLIRDMDQDFIDAGLGEKFSKKRGKKICNECMEKVEETLPQYKKDFKEINILDRILGYKCPICGK